MTFEGQYLTYAEYQALGGSAIGETPFNLLEFEARKKIDLRTQNRLIGQETIPNEVKLCDFHLIGKIVEIQQEQIKTSGVSSEGIDGYSISYANASEVKDILKTNDYIFDDIIMNDLYGVVVNNTTIIYNGVI